VFAYEFELRADLELVVEGIDRGVAPVRNAHGYTDKAQDN
jgi:hypothetical protein